LPAVLGTTGILFAYPFNHSISKIPSTIGRLDRGVRIMKIPSNLGMLLLGIWLIVQGALALLSISLGGLAILVPILAVVAGILIIMGR
jgi:hypothetical protein